MNPDSTMMIPVKKPVLYFSYGSNMSTRRLQERIPSARKLCVAELGAHRLLFHKISRVDGSAKCDALYTGNGNDCVVGVVYELQEPDKAALDNIEGSGHGYREKQVLICNTGGENLTAFTYYATEINASLRPYSWYKEHVLAGAREHNLPQEYIAGINKVVSVDDPDQNRHEEEMAIYRAHKREKL